MRQIAIFALLAAAPSMAQSTFRGNNAHTGVYQGAGPKQLGGVKWAFKAGRPIVTSPATYMSWKSPNSGANVQSPSSSSPVRTSVPPARTAHPWNRQ